MNQTSLFCSMPKYGTCYSWPKRMINRGFRCHSREHNEPESLVISRRHFINKFWYLTCLREAGKEGMFQTCGAGEEGSHIWETGLAFPTEPLDSMTRFVLGEAGVSSLTPHPSVTFRFHFREKPRVTPWLVDSRQVTCWFFLQQHLYRREGAWKLV